MFKSPKSIFVIALIGCLILVISNMVTGTWFDYSTRKAFLEDFSFVMLYTFALSYVNGVFFDFMKKQIFTSYDVVKRIIFGILGATAITVAAIFILRFCI